MGPRRVIFKGIPRGAGAGHHNGGRLAFGPDGMLYVTVGDTGDSSLAQNVNSLAGKVLRIKPRGGIPADNPYGNAVWTMGHRNVEGITFDHNGRCWASEFGEKTRDEMNHIVKGDNYGWPNVEGGDGSGPYHDPFVTWSPTSTLLAERHRDRQGQGVARCAAGRVRLLGEAQRSRTAVESTNTSQVAGAGSAPSRRHPTVRSGSPPATATAEAHRRRPTTG